MSKKQSIKFRLIVYPILAVIFAIMAYFIAVTAMGYHYHLRNGKLIKESTGAIILSSRPGDASIYLDDRLYDAKTPLFTFLTVQINDLSTKDHKIGIKKSGYVDWSGIFKVYPGMVSWGTQILLLPQNRTATAFNLPTEIESTIVSPDKTRELAVTHDKSNSALAFWQINTTNKTNVKLFEKSLVEGESYLPVSYSFDNQRILFERTLGEQKSYLVFEATQNGNSWDITDTFKTSFESYTFNPRNHDELYGLRSGDMFKIGYVSKNLSGVLFSNVRGVYPEDLSALEFIQKNNNYINLYRLESNGTANLLVRGLTDSPTYQVAYLSTSFGYAVLPGSTKTLVVYPTGNPDASPAKIAENVTFILPSPKDQFLGYGNDSSFYVYENGKGRYFTTYTGRQVSSLVWFNDQFNLSYVENGKLKMITYSGFYDQNVFDAANTFPVVASPDGPRLFYVGTNKSKNILDLYLFDFTS